MAVVLNKGTLTFQQMKYIKLCCTYLPDPISKQKQIYKDAIKTLAAKGEIHQVASKFALDNFFGPLDELLLKYLGSKLKRGNGYNKPKDAVEFYVNVGENVIVPMMIGNIIMSKKVNFERKHEAHTFTFKGQLREYQANIVPELESQLEKYGSTILGVYPGFGKTIMGAYFAARKGLLTCIGIHRSIQIKQWINTFTKYTTAKIWVVDDAPPPEDVDVIICMDGRLFKIPVAMRMKVGTLIIDEAHAFCVSSRSTFWLSFFPKYLMTLSATLKRPDDAMECMAYACGGNWGVFIKSDKIFHVHPITTHIKASEKGKMPWNEMVASLLNNQQRNAQILELVKTNKSRKVLILTPQVEHVKTLARLCTGERLTVSTFCGNDKTYTDAPILIGTVSKIGTAFDEETFCDTFDGTRLDVCILCLTLKKFTTLEQVLGRIMRSQTPDIYILIDNESQIQNHWRLMKWWLESYTSAVIC